MRVPSGPSGGSPSGDEWHEDIRPLLTRVGVAIMSLIGVLGLGFAAADAFADLPWTREAIAQRLKSEAAKHGLKPPQLMMPLRMLVAGTTQTPSLDAVLSLLPREAVRSRIAAGLQV